MIVTTGTVPSSPCARLAQTCHTWSPSVLTVTLGGGKEGRSRPGALRHTGAGVQVPLSHCLSRQPLPPSLPLP